MDALFASLIQDFVDETAPLALSGVRLAQGLISDLSESREVQESLRAIRSTLHTIKGNASMMGFLPIERLAHGLEDLARPPILQQKDFAQLLLEGFDLLVQGVESAANAEPDAAATEAFLAKITLAMASAQAGQGSPASGFAETDCMKGALVVSPSPWEPGTVGVKDGIIDELLEQAGEALVGQGELARIHSRLARGQVEAGDTAIFGRVLDLLLRTSLATRDRLLSLRLSPIETLFRRYDRYVRELGQKRGQVIALRVEGGEVAVDRAVIARLHEPLTHMIRNAVAHGIESPEGRKAVGKPEAASIYLGAKLVEGRVRIVVADDGKGLDRVAIVRKAKSLGLEVDETSTATIDRLIFYSGFSTAGEVSSLAGRGVGLDVVAEVVQALGGNIEVRSAPGQGTAFILEVPVTVSRQKVLVFGVDSERYGAVAGFVEETLATCESELLDQDGLTFMPWRSARIPVVDGGALLGSQGISTRWTRPYTLVFRAGNRVAAILVDWLAPVQELVMKPLHPIFGTRVLIGRAAVTGQGRVVPVLDFAEVAQRMRGLRNPRTPYPVEERSYHVI